MSKNSISDRVLNVIVYTVIILISIICIVPIWNAIVLSVTPAHAQSLTFSLWPKAIDFSAWKSIVNSSFMWQCFRNSGVRTILGTLLSVVLTVLTAYPLSRSRMPMRRFFSAMLTFTLIFNAGMIPTFLTVQGLGLMNTIWALLLPGAISAYNVIIMRNFFEAIPKSIEEACMIDGAGDFTTLIKVILPLSLPSIATISLWVAVSHWNAWFDVLLYINDRSQYVLPMVLREFQAATEFGEFGLGDRGITPPTAESIQNASLLFVIIPILLVYPFLQKYFVKGVTVGSVKE